MKYNEFIHVNNEFNPVYDLENEEDNAWKLFIANDKFNEVLSSVIDSLDVNKQKNPVWLQGTYGTGKSHATSVIKHLLSDDDISSFDLKNGQLTAKLNKFREDNNVLPVILKGTSTIGTPEKFRLTLQNAVKNTLKNKDMRVTVPSDFERIIELLEQDSISFPEKYIRGTLLEAYNPDEIKIRLEKQDTDTLIAIEEVLEKMGLGSIQLNIVEWLSNIRAELKKEYDIDYLMIFWDEFTGALNQLNVEDILGEIQNIAEEKNNGLSLFIVSHRTRSTQLDINEERIEKIMDRFKKINYSMEPVATYELMEKSITKDDGWEDAKNRRVQKIRPVIRRINKKDLPNVENALENLYPIHPYTSYLATFISREIGSTERSIFRFLHDDTDNGFKQFIDTYEIDDRYYLTAEYLWDFFYNDFEDIDDEKINSAVQHYKLHQEKLKEKGIEYITIFKVILLLNILYKLVDVNRGSLAIPSRSNINDVFVGSIYEDNVDEVLNFIDKQSIINETPDNLFELTTNVLDQAQVTRELEKLRKKVNLKMILDSKREERITGSFTKKVIREIEIQIKDGNIQKNRLIDNLEKGLFKKPGYLHMLIFLCKNGREVLEIQDTLKSIRKTGLLENTIVIVSESSFNDNNLNKFLGCLASAEVSKKHNYKEDVKVFNERANKLADDWVNRIRNGMIHWYVNENDERCTFGEFTNIINEKISKEIFYNGLENINEAKKNKNIWPYKHPKVQAKHYLNSRTYEELKSNLNDRFLSILFDNNGDLIVTSNLELKDNVPNNHPIKLIGEFVDNQFEKAQLKGTFNLGHELKPLSKEPFGLYPSEVNLAALSFVMRKYVNKLYDNKGNSINEPQMEEKVLNIFEYWGKDKKEDKLYVRFGSEDERKLINLLIKVFELKIDSDKKSIDSVRWGIKNWIKENRSPLWLFNYSEKITPSLKEAINGLSELLRPENKSIPDSTIQNCYDSIDLCIFDFEDLINSNKEEIFKKYILEKENKINSDDIPEVIDYIIRVMPEEIYDWNEETVDNKILKWYIESIERQTPIDSGTDYVIPIRTSGSGTGTDSVIPTGTSDSGTGTDSVIPTGTSGSGTGGQDESKSLISKIEKEKPEKVKTITIMLLKENEDFRLAYEKYFKDDMNGL